MEQLFSLGLRSRSECEELLQSCDWNLEESSTVILDSAGSHGNASAQLNRWLLEERGGKDLERGERIDQTFHK